MTQNTNRGQAMVEFLTMPGLSTIDMGALTPKQTSIVGDQLEAAKQLWASADGLMKIGIWECTPGRFTASRDTASETCHIISGRVTLHGQDGREQQLLAGDMLVLPKGWRGEWTIHEHTRKLYIMHADVG